MTHCKLSGQTTRSLGMSVTNQVSWRGVLRMPGETIMHIQRRWCDLGNRLSREHFRRAHSIELNSSTVRVHKVGRVVDVPVLTCRFDRRVFREEDRYDHRVNRQTIPGKEFIWAATTSLQRRPHSDGSFGAQSH